MQNAPAENFQANFSQIHINGLNPCLSYWVVVTSDVIGCDNQLSSQPQVIGYFQSSEFKFAISIEDITSCEEWIAVDPAGKATDVEMALNSQLESSSCGTSVPCMARSQFTCEGGEINYK
jgi:hypothetical protein